MHTFLDERDKATIDEQLNNLEAGVNGLKGDLDNIDAKIKKSFEINYLLLNNISSGGYNVESVIYIPMPEKNIKHTIKLTSDVNYVNAYSTQIQLFYSNNDDGSLINVFNPNVEKTFFGPNINLNGEFTPTQGNYLAVFVRVSKTEPQLTDSEAKLTNIVLEIDGNKAKVLSVKKWTNCQLDFSVEYNFNGIGITREEFESSTLCIKDSDNNKYRTFVQYGQLKTRKYVYRKVLCFGNSITKHPRKDEIGWITERGMASSRLSVDYPHFLKDGLSKKYENVVVDCVYGASWEQDFNTDLDALIGTLLNNSYDLVIIHLGANVPISNVPDFESALKSLVIYFHQKFKNADIMICNTFGGDKTKDEALFNTSCELNTMYQWSDEINPFFDRIAGCGQWCYSNDETSMFALTNATVFTHPGDLYFLKRANGILETLGYETLDIEHSITVSVSEDYTCHNTLPSGSLVTCLFYGNTQPNVSVKANGENIQFEIKSYSEITWLDEPDKTPTYAVVFEMPNYDVIISN